MFFYFFHVYFIQISSYSLFHMNISYMFFIISIWKYHVLLECIMNTLRKHWNEKSHLLKKPDNQPLYKRGGYYTTVGNEMNTIENNTQATQVESRKRELYNYEASFVSS